ncbi:hypothetical protein CCO02nite_07970 [Cellulomonas composti]|uniref:Uncharacterized protein n=1 Tax=Cellulomonas composti TaxID=266130 RepID=A0A511J8V5_9CELL|nr:hypothetical protein CCO02nite_07970 [Cellulomonas composti]
MPGRLSRVEIAKARTAKGRGRWGQDTYDVELISGTQSWWDSSGTQRRSLSSFELACSAPVGSRHFATVADRDAFIAASFSELELEPVEPPEVWHEEPSLCAALGEELVDVEFVEDYFRLLWADDYLAVYANVAIIESERRRDQSDAEFAARLCSLVGRRLVAVDEVLDRGLVLTFEGPIELEVSLRDAAEGVVDAAEHSSKDLWSRGSLWLVGEPPFER